MTVKKQTHIGVNRLTKEILKALKASNSLFYRSDDHILICALTDHVLKLQSEGKLEVLCSRNPELKKYLAKLIYAENNPLGKSASVDNSLFSFIQKKRGNQNNKSVRSIAPG